MPCLSCPAAFYHLKYTNTMGSSDLNLKKSWHPSTFKNQERVWKEEKKKKEEDAKIEQMRKELAEERQLQDLQRMQEDAGTK